MGLFSSAFSHIQLNKTKPNPHLNHSGSLVHHNHFKAVHADGTRKAMLEMMWRLLVAVAGGWKRAQRKGWEASWEGGEDQKAAEKFMRCQPSACSPTHTLSSKPTKTHNLNSLSSSFILRVGLKDPSILPALKQPGYQGKGETLGWFHNNRSTDLCLIYSSFSKAVFPPQGWWEKGQV